ncbi:hypothetical protein EVAR_41435_1 [Eumeta japonica]|uniref:Uncharacterized protein n=1 Tax=Eumeta variegata TaxID=151549 RepID=A0A4C1W6B3_EUMVA|nr:hypothetical protein EVAR_41435_1 [Eumeta japonica]
MSFDKDELRDDTTRDPGAKLTPDITQRTPECLCAITKNVRQLKKNKAPEFKRGRVNLRDEFFDYCPSTAVNNKNIDGVRRMIETDRHVSYHES